MQHEWWESRKEREHYEYQDTGGWIILKCILEGQDGVVWTGSIWLRIGTSEGLVNAVMNLRVP
jgi:hypothetical protein